MLYGFMDNIPMLNIPNNILVQYEALLKRKISDVSAHKDYLKWLRYFGFL